MNQHKIDLSIALVYGPEKLQLLEKDRLEPGLDDIELNLSPGDVVTFCRETSGYDDPATTHWVILDNRAVSRAHLTLRVDPAGSVWIADTQCAVNKAMLDGALILSGSRHQLSGQHSMCFSCIEEDVDEDGFFARTIRGFELDVCVSRATSE
jgi:hypothetical protein